MKYLKSVRIFTLALVIALLVSLIPSSMALAATLTIYPSTAQIGDECRLDGYDFNIIGQTYKIYLSNESASIDDYIDLDVDNYEYLGDIRVTLAGVFEEFFYFNVPSRLTDGETNVTVRGGDYYVYVTLNDKIHARAILTIEAIAIITIDKDEGIVGTEVEIDGEGYDTTEDIIVEFDGSEVDIVSGDDSTDSNGEFDNTKIVIPESTAGTHTITVTGDDSNLEAAVDFTVEPSITVSPASGAVGTEITVQGYGFGDEVDVTVYFSNSITEGETDDDGSFTVEFQAPSVAPGSYPIDVLDDDDNAAEGEFEIATVSIELSTSEGNIGQTVAVSGSGFVANSTITITFGDTAAGSATSDANGNFGTSFNVPSVTVGEYGVVAEDSSGNTAGKMFKITTSAEISPATSSSSPGYVGSQITASGGGFTPSGTARITYDGIEVATSPIDANGGFSVSFNAPASKGGEHAVIATDGTISQSFTFFMESTPPETPPPLKPEMGIKADAQAYFDWEDVTDPSGVTYTLQIASSEDFSEEFMVLEKTGLTESEYTLTSEERLDSVSEDAPYYWHVKAIDGALNESSWTGTGTFYVGFTFRISQPIIYLIIGICAVLLAGFTFWLGRKTAYY